MLIYLIHKQIMATGTSIPFQSVEKAIAAGRTQAQIDQYLTRKKQEHPPVNAVKDLIEGLPVSVGKPEADNFFGALTMCVLQGQEKVSRDKFLATVIAYLTPIKDIEQKNRDQAAKIRQLQLQIKKLSPGHAKADLSKLHEHLLAVDPLKNAPGVKHSIDEEFDVLLSKFVKMSTGKVDKGAAMQAIANNQAAEQAVKDAQAALAQAKERAAKARAAAAAAVDTSKNEGKATG